MVKKKPDPFFIGWAKKPPKSLQKFLFLVSAIIVGAAAGVAFGVGSSVPDPGDARFAWGAGYQTFTGYVDAKPYPILRLPAGEGGHSKPHAMIISGVGKRGMQTLAGPLSGQPVDAGGILLKRGDMDMLQVGGGVSLRAAENPAANFTPAPAEHLGKWRLTGEICDGKCYSGAMRPGVGLAHKACANLCIIGGIPPVLVTVSPLLGHEFFLLANKDGGPLTSEVQDWTALLISLEGEVERRDDMMIFKVDLDTAKQL